MWLDRIVLAVVLVVIALWAQRVSAEELTPETAASIYALAYGQFPGELPEHAPTIRLTSRERMAERFCHGTCSIRGMQDGDTVYIDETLDFANAVEASILLHEFIHYIQWARRGQARDCEEWARREQEAFRIQLSVLEKVGARTAEVLVAARQIRSLCR